VGRHHANAAFLHDFIDDDKIFVQNVPTVLAGDFQMRHTAAVREKQENVLRGCCRQTRLSHR
jgi:hypothetical protein